MDGSILEDGTVVVTEEKSNGLGFDGLLAFGEDGKMVYRNGVEGGYYYENNHVVKGLGLIKIDDDYYYVKLNGSIVVGRVYVTEEKANGLLEEGYYTFDLDGKMKYMEGVEDGFYYEDNHVVPDLGLVKVEEDYYYVKVNGGIFVGKVFIPEEKTNGFVVPGYYVFDVDGKMVK